MGLSGIPCDMNALGRCSRLDTDLISTVLKLCADTDRSGRSVVTKKDGVGHPRPTPSSVYFLQQIIKYAVVNTTPNAKPMKPGSLRIFMTYNLLCYEQTGRPRPACSVFYRLLGLGCDHAFAFPFV